MRDTSVSRAAPVILLLIVPFLTACAGQVYAPKGGMLFHPRELAAATQAVNSARAAGKDRECPEAFREAARLEEEAYTTYWSCRTAEAIRMANDAAARAAALCPRPAALPAPTVSITANPASVAPGQCTTLTWTAQNAASASIDQGVGTVDPAGSRQVCPASTARYTIAASGSGGSATASTMVTVAAPPVLPPPAPLPLAPPTPPPAAPTVSITADPASVTQGACTTLRWTSTNATSATIDQGVGSVAASGTRQVCPAATTPYGIVATGPGGSGSASTRVTVTPAPRVIERLTIRVNFDFDKANIRAADLPELQKALDFVKRHAGRPITIEGHTDGRGTVKYNQRLSERRAAAVKAWLVKNGAPNPDRLKTVGFGKSKPIANNSTDAGRFQNRRVELVATSE